MSTRRTTDDRDTDYRRHKEITDWLEIIGERLAVIERRLQEDADERELARPLTREEREEAWGS